MILHEKTEMSLLQTSKENCPEVLSTHPAIIGLFVYEAVLINKEADNNRIGNLRFDFLVILLF